MNDSLKLIINNNQNRILQVSGNDILFLFIAWYYYRSINNEFDIHYNLVNNYKNEYIVMDSNAVSMFNHIYIEF